MDTSQLITIIAATAAASSLLTALVIRIYVPRLYRSHLKPDLEKLPRLIGEEVEAGVKRSAREMLPDFEERVKKGMMNGVKDITTLSPDFTSSFIQSGVENIGENLGIFSEVFNPGKKRRRR